MGMNIKKTIAMLGTAGSGKDTAAKYIQQGLTGTALLAFADPLKEFGREVFDFSSETLYGSSSRRNEVFPEWATTERWRLAIPSFWRVTPEWVKRVLITYKDSPVYIQLLDAVGKWFYELRAESLGKGLSARRMLQTLGTECGRTVSPDVWANYGLHRAQNFLLGDHRCAVITDCRFINEGKLVRAKGGEVWFMDRPIAGLEGDAGKHQSEVEIRTPEMQQYVTRTFRNGGTLDELKLMVDKAVDDLFER